MEQTDTSGSTAPGSGGRPGAGAGVGLGLPAAAAVERDRAARARDPRRADDRRHHRAPCACWRRAIRRPSTCRARTSRRARSSPASGASFCEWKGHAVLPRRRRRRRRRADAAAWFYPEPVAGVRARSATTSPFYPARMDACFVDDERVRAAGRATSTAAGSPTRSSGRSRARRAPGAGEPPGRQAQRRMTLGGPADRVTTTRRTAGSCSAPEPRRRRDHHDEPARPAPSGQRPPCRATTRVRRGRRRSPWRRCARPLRRIDQPVRATLGGRPHREPSTPRGGRPRVDGRSATGRDRSAAARGARPAGAGATGPAASAGGGAPAEARERGSTWGRGPMAPVRRRAPAAGRWRRGAPRTWAGVSGRAGRAIAPLWSAATAPATVALALEVPSKHEVYARSSDATERPRRSRRSRPPRRRPAR